MRWLFHSSANRVAALFMKLLFGSVARLYVLRRENSNRAGGFLLASNHISHFDPFIISSVVRRKIDWMAMAEFFPLPLLGLFLRAVDAFPAERDRADRKTIRTAIDRLKHGRIVGLFPEGGIRDGPRSVLEGAAAAAGRIDACAYRRSSSLAMRDRRQRSPLLKETLAAVAAHAHLDRLRQPDPEFSRSRKICRPRAHRARIGQRVQIPFR